MDDARKAAEAILEDLRGYTSLWASERIVNVFTSRSAAAGRLIVQELKRRAPEEKTNAKGMMDWLFGDLTAEDRGKLRQWFIDNRIGDDVIDMAADEILDRLKGWTSEDDAHEILKQFSSFMSQASAGADIDTLLSRLESKAKLDAPAMARWLFGDLDRVTAWKLGSSFYHVATPKAVDYAATWSADKIYNLLAGFTSHSDSSDIVNNFQLVEPTFRDYVYHRLDLITRSKRNQEAVDALMSDMDKSDYEKLQAMPGLKLRPYDRKVPWYQAAAEWIVGALDWVSIVAEWVVCGAIGIITGLLSVIWDFVVLVKDIVVAAWDILWAIIYLVSQGGAGSAEYLRVKEFILGIGHAFAHPADTFSQMWEELKLEIKTIEGPLSDCRIAELIVRKVVNGIVNIILIFAAGYGLVKLGASALKAAAEFADLVRKIGFVRAVLQVGGEAAEAFGKALGSVSGKLAKVAQALASPIETLAKLRGELTTLVLAAREEGYWAYLRRQAGAKVEAETDWWRKNQAFWEQRATEQQTKALGTEVDANRLAADALAEREPAPTAVTGVQSDVGKLESDVDALKKDVIGDEKPLETGEEPRAEEGAGKPGRPVVAAEEPRAKAKTPDGEHEIQIRGDEVARCSTSCPLLRRQFRKVINARPDLDETLTRIESIAAGDTAAAQRAADQAALLEQRLRTVEEIQGLSDSALSDRIKKAPRGSLLSDELRFEQARRKTPGLKWEDWFNRAVGWPPAEPFGPKPGPGEPGAAEWRYRRYVYDSWKEGHKPADVLDFQDWKDRYFDVVVEGGRPGRPGGPAQQATRKALTGEGYTNVENVQLGEGNYVDMVGKNAQGGTEFVEVDDILQKGIPRAGMRDKIADEIAGLKPGETLLYVDKDDMSLRILYRPGDDVETLTVEASRARLKGVPVGR